MVWLAAEQVTAVDVFRFLLDGSSKMENNFRADDEVDEEEGEYAEEGEEDEEDEKGKDGDEEEEEEDDDDNDDDDFDDDDDATAEGTGHGMPNAASSRRSARRGNAAAMDLASSYRCGAA